MGNVTEKQGSIDRMASHYVCDDKAFESVVELFSIILCNRLKWVTYSIAAVDF